MGEWLAYNLGTIVVVLILIGVFTWIAVTLIRDKKSGKGGCGCGCESCALHGKCGKAEKTHGAGRE